MEKNVNESFKEKLEDIIKNKAYAFNKKSLEKIKKEVNFYKIKGTTNEVSTQAQDPFKGVIMMFAGFFMLGLPTITGSLAGGSESEILPFFKHISTLFSLITGFAGIMFSFIGIMHLKRYADTGGRSSSTVTNSSIKKDKMEIFEKDIKKEKFITSLLNIEKYENLDKNRKNAIKNLDSLSESKLNKEKKDCLDVIKELIELYKKSNNKSNLKNIVKVEIAKDQEKNFFLKEELFNLLIDIDKDIDFNEVNINSKKKNIKIKSI